MTAIGPVLSKSDRGYMTVRSWSVASGQTHQKGQEMTTPALLLWIDLETTGDDPDNDVILEVGAILTDTDLNRLETFDWLVKDPTAKIRLASAVAVVQEMHLASGLAEMVHAGHGIALNRVERDLIAGCRQHLKEGQTVVLAGSGVGHFDLRFIRTQMPELAAMLAYYVIDVGVLRRSFEMWGCDDMLLEKGVKPHRALEDAELHLREAQTIKKSLGELRTLAFPMAIPELAPGKAFVSGAEVELLPGDVVELWECTSCPASVPFGQRSEHIASHSEGDELDRLADMALDAAMSDGVMKVTPEEFATIGAHVKLSNAGYSVLGESLWPAAVARAAARRGVIEPDGMPPIEIVVAK